MQWIAFSKKAGDSNHHEMVTTLYKLENFICKELQMNHKDGISYIKRVPSKLKKNIISKQNKSPSR